MAIDYDADLDFAFKDASGANAPNVVTARASTYGIFDENTALESTDGDGLQQIGTTVLVRTGTVTDLTTDLPIAVNGVNYVVRWYGPSPMARSDGRMTLIALTKVTA